MSKDTQQSVEQFIEAPQIQNFLESDYFTAICELGALSHLGVRFFIPDTSKGMFSSLYQRHVFKATQPAKDSSIKVQFNMVNRYLYEYNRQSRTYSKKKEENYNLFISKVKELCDTKAFTLFSLTPVTSTDELSEALSK